MATRLSLTRVFGCVLGGFVLAAAAWATADEIQLRGGGTVSGIVVQKTNQAITIETSPGLVTLPMSRVEKVVSSRSPLEIWRERSNTLSPKDVEGWAALARWAEQQRLETQARAAWEHVLSINPRNAEANAALGRVQVNGAWVSREEAYRAQGLVQFEGRWLSRAEYEAVIQERAAEAAANLGRQEAELRIREAQARAREAEARARGAEAANMAQTYEGDGLPLGYTYGGYYPPYDGAYGGLYGDGLHGRLPFGRGLVAPELLRTFLRNRLFPFPTRSIGPLPARPAGGIQSGTLVVGPPAGAAATGGMAARSSGGGASSRGSVR